MTQVAWGSIGADEYSGIFTGGGHKVSAIVEWAGDEVVNESEFSGLFSAFKKVAKSVAKVGKAVTSTAKKITPYVAAGAAAASVVFPPAAPAAAAVASAVAIVGAADKFVPKVSKQKTVKVQRVLAAAKKSPTVRKELAKTFHRAKAGNPRAKKALATIVAVKAAERKRKARALIRNTKKEAAKGHPGAVRAMKYFRTVHKSRSNAASRGLRLAWSVDRRGYVHRVM